MTISFQLLEPFDELFDIDESAKKHFCFDKNNIIIDIKNFLDQFQNHSNYKELVLALMTGIQKTAVYNKIHHVNIRIKTDN